MKIKNTIKILTIVIVFLVGIDGLRAKSILDNTELSISNSYDSNYISEGRCNLASGGLSSLNADISYYWIDINMWLGTGLDSDYRELQYSGGLSYDLRSVGISIGLTDLSFLHDDSKDQEFYTELSYNKFTWFTPSLVNVYSFEADGSFLELLFEFNIPFKNNQIELKPFLLGGFDLGFVDETYCLNNFQTGVELSYQLIDNVSINGYVATSLGVWKDTPHENHSWWGVNISTDF
jgi:hypothetical protein